MSRRVAVAGFGVTGRSVARVLVAEGDRVLAFDDRPADDARRAADELGVLLEVTPDERRLRTVLAGCELVITSPGIPADHRVYRAAADAGVTVWSEIELAADRARAAGGPRLVAITGTNGKTTVTTMATGILAASGVAALAAGNIGLPLIDAVGRDVEVVVAEVSSFQLQYTERFHPHVSCWLNFAADHLDWHPTLDHYRAAKSRIWANQGAGDVAVLNADDPVVMKSAATVPDGTRRVTYSAAEPADYWVHEGTLVGPGGEELMRVDELPRSLPHDVSNSLGAAAVALSAGAATEAYRKGVAGFRPLPHRVSLVVEAGGVSWYDDSKATTPASVLAAVAGFGSVVLIAGGRNKGLDLSPLEAAVPPVKAVVAIGEAAPEVERCFSPRVPVVVASSMNAAVEAAAAFAGAGDAVLLSPGCASFDWYRSYADRGDDFARIVKESFGKRGNHADH